MKFSEPLLVKPSRNLTMLLAGKSREKCAVQNLSKLAASTFTSALKNPAVSPSPLTNRMVVSALGDAFTSPTRASSSSSSFSSVYKHTNHSGQPPPDSVVPTERAARTLITIKDWKQLHLLFNDLMRSSVNVYFKQK